MAVHSLSDSSSFEWDEYLSKTNGHPADSKCFKQAVIPPPNFFEVNSLLEAEDQRSAALDFQSAPVSAVDGAKSMTTKLLTSGTPNSRRSNLLTTPVSNVRRFRAAAFTLAQVIEVCGSRVRIRLVGTDDRNDCWFLVDSDQIRPYPSGEPLQPPFGYMHNHLHWSRTVKAATEGAKFADASCFITPPVGPADNYFQVGDKLEAVDRRNTQLICPATVGAINGQHILISFDGWSDFDYWTRFDSRELFPVGWCKLSGYPLQPPGPNALRSPTVHSTPATSGDLRANVLSNGLSLAHVDSSSYSAASKTPVRRPSRRGGLVSRVKLGRRKSSTTRRVPKNTTTDTNLIRSKTESLSDANIWERVSKPLKIVPSDSPQDYSQSADSSMRSLSSPPVIHPVNEESSLNLSCSSSDHPPIIEAAVPLPTKLPRERRASSSSDCVVRLHLKPSPSSANALDATKVEHKSWEVVRTTSPRRKSKKIKPVKRHRHSLSTNHRRTKKKLKLINSAPESSLNSTRPNSMTSGGSSSAGCRSSPVDPVKQIEPLSSHSAIVDKTKCTLSSNIPSRHAEPLRSQFPLHLYCDDFHGSSVAFPSHKPSMYSSIRPDSISSVDPTDDELMTTAARISNGQSVGRYWCSHLKSESLSSKLMDNCITSQTAEDYLDGQSLAPQISSSTVSPSSLDLGPGQLPNPSFWTIDEVCHYITTRDSSLTEVAEKFKHHEIDGQALLLLSMESLRNYLQLKLGPALKVDHLISRLKRGIL